MFIDMDQFKAMMSQAVYAGVRQALEDVGTLQPGQVTQPNKEAVEKVVAEVVKEDEPAKEEAKPKEPRKPRKKKAAHIVEVTPEKEEFQDEPEEAAPTKEEAPAEEMSAEDFISQVKANSGGDPVKAKKILKALCKVTKFADCPADRRVEFIEALKYA